MRLQAAETLVALHGVTVVTPAMMSVQRAEMMATQEETARGLADLDLVAKRQRAALQAAD